MRILFLTFYFPPDLCAGSFRAGALVEQLLPRLPPDAHIDVLTTRPNRYASIENFAPDCEERGTLLIKRISLPVHKSGMVDQARAFVAYDREVVRYTRGKKYDLVFATSSRLMTAFLGARVAKRLGAPLYLDVRDIFVDTMKDVLNGVTGKILLPVLDQIERYTMKRAVRVNLVSEGFKPYFEKRYPAKHFDFFTNGIDDEFLSDEPHVNSPLEGQPVRILYAGNIGEGQGLHRILPQLAKMAGPRYRFTVIGDGGRKDQLIQELVRERVQNVEIKRPVMRSELIDMYNDADVLFLHLNDFEAFAKVLPSKLFEYAATGKPMLAGVAGYSATFLKNEVENCAVFPPCDVGAGLAALKGMSMEVKMRAAFVQRYARTAIMGRMADTVVAAAKRNNSD